MRLPSFGWLTVWSTLGACFLIGLFFRAYLPSEGLRDVAGYALGRDFVNIWTAARLMLSGHIEQAYDLSAYMSAMRAYMGAGFPFHNWSYPPSILPFTLPFGLLAYGPALVLWSALGLVAYLAVARPKNLRAHWLPMLLLAFGPASLVNLLSGQNGFFTAALFLGGFQLLNRRPVLAGIVFGLLTCKPQLGILIPFALLLLGQWRAIAAAAITAALLVLVSIGLFGIDLWHSYMQVTAAHQRALLHLFEGFYTTMMPGPYAAMRGIGLAHSSAFLVHAATAFVASVAALGILRREGASARAILALALATMLVTPYGYSYDLTAISAALVVYLYSQRPTARERVLYGALWVLPAATYSIMLAHMPWAPVILLLPLLHLAHRSARPSHRITLVPFTPERAPYFDRFNRAWIEKFFWVEPFDNALLTDPATHIIAPGGEVWFAQMDGTIIGTAALLKNADGTFEFSKLGLAPEAKGQGVSRLLLHHCLNRARARGASTMRIFTHSSLATACAIYRAEGFVDCAIPEAEKTRYARADTLLFFDL